jgi:DNA helicase-2/ATP-dependent DNA helicase PcrA
MNNKLIIAAAGSGKTTYLIEQAIKYPNQKVLITTYTENNEEEIKSKIVEKYKRIPSNITIQTWFSFLIQHGVKPYQGTYNNLLFNKNINGLMFNNKNVEKLNGKERYKESVLWHYFTGTYQIYSNKLPKFFVKADEASNGAVIDRICRIYPHIFIDEIQDLAGYDLEILKLLFESNSNIILVGDPRQTTYSTNNERKNYKYREGNIKLFIEERCEKCNVIIDETTLSVSHRNNQDICNFAQKLYPEMRHVNSCSCCRNNDIKFQGIYFVKLNDVNEYLEEFSPVQLRFSTKSKINTNFSFDNFGLSKGKTFDRVIIYPTKDMIKWCTNYNQELKPATKAKFYVALTRAKYSVAIIIDCNDDVSIHGIKLYTPNRNNR